MGGYYEKKEKRIFKFTLRVIVALLAIIIFQTIGNVPDVMAKTKKVSMNYSVIRMTKGYSMRLKVKGTKKKVKWISSNKKIASVSSKGRVKGKSVGKCNVYARVSGIKLKCKVKIRKGNEVKEVKADYADVTLNLYSLKLDVSNLVFSQEKQSLIKMGKGEFTLKLLNTKDKPVWSSSNPEVATVVDGVVTANSAGNCTIEALLGAKKYTCNVEVTDLKDAKEIFKQYNIYAMLSLMNADRVKSKAAPLKIRESLNELADVRTGEIEKNFSHTRPDGTTYKTIYTGEGVNTWKFIGENIAYTSDNSRNIDEFTRYAYNALYNSKGHRENMLNPNYEYVGIGCGISNIDIDENDIASIETYWVQEFYR